MASPRWYEAPPGTVQTDFRHREGPPAAVIAAPTREASMARDYALLALGIAVLLVIVGIFLHFVYVQ